MQQQPRFRGWSRREVGWRRSGIFLPPTTGVARSVPIPRAEREPVLERALDPYSKSLPRNARGGRGRAPHERHGLADTARLPRVPLSDHDYSSRRSPAESRTAVATPQNASTGEAASMAHPRLDGRRGDPRLIFRPVGLGVHARPVGDDLDGASGWNCTPEVRPTGRCTASAVRDTSTRSSA